MSQILPVLFITIFWSSRRESFF